MQVKLRVGRIVDFITDGELYEVIADIRAADDSAYAEFRGGLEFDTEEEAKEWIAEFTRKESN